MSWDGKEFEKPLILLKHETVEDAVNKNNYKLDEQFQELVKETPRSQQFVEKLAESGKIQDACDFLSYIITPRNGVWWSALCLLKTRKEILDAIPEAELRQQELELQKQQELVQEKLRKQSINDFVAEQDKVKKQLEQKWQDIIEGKITDPNDPFKAIQDQYQSENPLKELLNLQKEIENTINEIPPELNAEARKVVALTDEKFKQQYGKSIQDMIKDAILESATPQAAPPESTAFLDKLEAELDQDLAETKIKIAEVKNYFALRIPGVTENVSSQNNEDALVTALRWLMAPTKINAKEALEAGNEAASTPEGMLAYSAFWSGNDLVPEQTEQYVATPPGLIAQGFSSTLLMCALAEGGSLSDAERFEDFLKIGVEVSQGIDTWDYPRIKQLLYDIGISTVDLQDSQPIKKEKMDDNLLEAGISGFGRRRSF